MPRRGTPRPRAAGTARSRATVARRSHRDEGRDRDRRAGDRHHPARRLAARQQQDHRQTSATAAVPARAARRSRRRCRRAGRRLAAHQAGQANSATIRTIQIVKKDRFVSCHSGDAHVRTDATGDRLGEHERHHAGEAAHVLPLRHTVPQASGPSEPAAAGTLWPWTTGAPTTDRGDLRTRARPALRRARTRPRGVGGP